MLEKSTLGVQKVICLSAKNNKKNIYQEHYNKAFNKDKEKTKS